MTPTEGRVCTACKQHKPFTEFHRNVTAKSGYHRVCRPCKAAAEKKRRREQPQPHNAPPPAATIVGMALGVFESGGHTYAYRLLVDCPNGHEDILHLRGCELKPFRQVPCGVCRQTYSLPDPREVG